MKQCHNCKHLLWLILVGIALIGIFTKVPVKKEKIPDSINKISDTLDIQINED